VLADYDGGTGKTVGWIPVSFESKEDRWHVEAFMARSELVDSIAKFIDGTYELLGPKVQGNPEKIADHILFRHKGAVTYPDAPREFTALSKWLEGKDIEGLVFHHPDGRMAKIKKRDFGQRRL